MQRFEFSPLLAQSNIADRLAQRNPSAQVIHILLVDPDLNGNSLWLCRRWDGALFHRGNGDSFHCGKRELTDGLYGRYEFIMFFRKPCSKFGIHDREAGAGWWGTVGRA